MVILSSISVIDILSSISVVDISEHLPTGNSGEQYLSECVGYDMLIFCNVYLFICFEKESMHVRAGEGQRERQNPKQAPCSAQSQTRGSISQTMRS